MTKITIVLWLMVSLAGCSSKQVAQAVYGSAKSVECYDRQYELNCDLDQTDKNLSEIQPAKNGSNEDLEQTAEKIRKQN